MKKFIPIIILVFVGVAVLFLIKPKQTIAPKNENQNNSPVPNETSSLDISLPLSNDPKDVAWALFQKYLGYNKSKNIEGIKQTVYKVASVCEDPKTKIDCEGRMAAAYSYGIVLKKEDFKNVWSDEKQIILATDFKINEDDSSIGRNRAIIFFIKDESGNLKMLSFSPFKGATAGTGDASREELIDRLVTYTEDKDNDGISDYIEGCIPVENKDTCVPTDPKLQDTNGNGLWDGIEALMK